MTRSRPWLVVAALAVLLVVVTGVTYLVVRQTAAPTPVVNAGSAPASTAPQASTVAPAPPSSSPTSAAPLDPNAGDAAPGDGEEPASKAEQSQWEPVAVGFAKALTTGPDDARAWRARLARYATPALQDQLASVDPRRLPGGRYTDHEVIQYDDTTAVVVATYSKDWAVAISLISDGDTWKVYQYDRWEG